MMMKKDEVLHLKKDNRIFLDEEKERVQSEADQEIAEVTWKYIVFGAMFTVY